MAYALGGFGSRAISFLVFPVYSHIMSANNFGQFDYIMGLVALFIPLISLQMSEAAYRWMIAGSCSDKEKSVVYSNALFAVGVGMVLGLPLIYVVCRLLEVNYFYQISLLVASSILFSLMQQILRGVGETKAYAAIGLMNAALCAAISVIGLLNYEDQVSAIVISYSLSNLICIAALQLFIKRWLNFRFEGVQLQRIWEFVVYSVPLIGNVVGWWALAYINRYYIVEEAGYTENGVYGVAYRFATIMTLVNSVFLMSMQDKAMADKDSKDKIASDRGIFEKFFKFEVSVVLVLTCLAPMLNMLLGVEYHDSWKYFPLLLASAAFQGLGAFVGLGYQKHKRTAGIFLTTIVAVTVNTIVTVAFIGDLGLYAPAIGSLIGFFLMYLVRVWAMRRLYSVGVSGMKLISFAVAFAFFYVLSIRSNGLYGYMMAIPMTALSFWWFRGEIKGAIKMVRRGLKTGGD